LSCRMARRSFIGALVRQVKPSADEAVPRLDVRDRRFDRVSNISGSDVSQNLPEIANPRACSFVCRPHRIGRRHPSSSPIQFVVLLPTSESCD
jgi:hypothetical protein